MKYLSIFAIAALLAGATILLLRTADLTSDTPTGETISSKSPDATKHENMDHTMPNDMDHNDHKGDGKVVDHSTMDHTPVKTTKVGDAEVDHSKMDHTPAKTTKTDDTEVDHSTMDHSKTDASKAAVANPALKDIDFTVSIAGRMKLDAKTTDGLTVLNNSLDPVSGTELGESVVTSDYQGFQIRFEDQKSADKFARDPLRYISRLSLEYVDAKTLKLVDAQSYKIAYATNCFSMGGEIDYEDDIYLLHRGYKFYFCCWPGKCGATFVEDPSAAYEHYGLKEVAGELVPLK